MTDVDADVEDNLEEEGERAMALWESGAHDEAAVLYAEVIGRCDADDPLYPLLQGELATLLAEMGRDAEALPRFEEALKSEIAASKDPASGSVALARWSLGNHALKMKNPALALETVTPALGKSTPMEWALRAVEAEAQWSVGKKEKAQTAARLALRASPNDRLATLRERLALILEG